MGNLETGFSGRSISFFSLPSSRVFDHEISVDEAIIEAGMDFEVGKRPAYQQLNDGLYAPVPGQFVSYRMDTEAAFSTVGNQWTPFNNVPAFAFIEELLSLGAEDNVVIDAAGTWNNGADCFVSARLQNGITVAGEGEEIDWHLLFKNNHAGKGAVSTYITAHRISCTNQINSAVGKAVSKWAARHTRTVGDRIQEAATSLKLVAAYQEEFEGAIRQLQETEVALAEFEAFVKDLLPGEKGERVRKSMLETYNTSDTVTHGNAWGAYNAITEALDWKSPRQTGIESRFSSGLDGPIAATRSRAMRMLLNR